MSATAGPGLGVLGKAVLALRIWLTYVGVRARVGRLPLPELVARLCDRTAARRRPPLPAAWLGDVVGRVLRPVARDDTCLHRSLVLLGLLRSQGDRAVLVIGLPPRPIDHRAHAWIELDGVDVGPPPGRGDNHELARYGDEQE